METKLNAELKKEWEIHLGGGTRIPLYDDMINFLLTQCRILENSQQNYEQNESSDKQMPKNTIKKPKNDCCNICKESLWLFFCPSFDHWPVFERKKYVRDNDLCPICFHKHKQEECKSKYRCKSCKGNHNTKLHESSSFQVNSISHETSSNKNDTIQVENRKTSKIKATAIVKIKGKNGVIHLMRAFVDKGSNDSFISEHAAQTLGLKRKHENIHSTGLDDKPLGNSKSSIEIEIQSVTDESFKISLNALIVSSIMPPTKIDSSHSMQWSHLKELKLADPEYSVTKSELPIQKPIHFKKE